VLSAGRWNKLVIATAGAVTEAPSITNADLIDFPTDGPGGGQSAGIGSANQRRSP